VGASFSLHKNKKLKKAGTCITHACGHAGYRFVPWAAMRIAAGEVQRPRMGESGEVRELDRPKQREDTLSGIKHIKQSTGFLVQLLLAKFDNGT
jgi:hypothetical protein